MDRKSEKLTIRVFGVVQGVGFRPFVARLAEERNLLGYVKNCGGYVEISVMDRNGSLRSFLHDLLSFSGVIKVETAPWTAPDPTDFRIVESTPGHELAVMLPADLPVCKHCMKELYDPSNRRFRHAFISCVDCGVRYSVIEDVPYDRETTTMREFPLCASCKSEYEEITNIRHYAQTICCKDCGPQLIYGSQYGESALESAISQLKNGGIIAIKGVGGYHLACLPTCESALLRLRSMKHREDKPLAVMFRDMDTIKKYCIVHHEEQALLESNARPIVLLERRASDIHPLVYRNSAYLGAFLPYTPYQHLLLDTLGALVLTSANVTNQAMIIADDEALKLPCDGVLYHKRHIATPLDDSVAAVCEKEPMLYRRARGYVPTPIYIPNGKGQVFAAGGDLKACFALQNGEYCYPSQYLGDLAEEENLSRWHKELARMQRIFDVHPTHAVCDLHPGYFSTAACKELGYPVIQVQHHFAHTLSVMAEYGLSEVIGVCFDGTGFGTDGTVWGGEFLLCNRHEFTRCGHIEPFKMLGGDDAARDAVKTAICTAYSFDIENTLHDTRDTIIHAALEHDINTIQTTSVGRLFDAVSATLGLCMENHFEGACGEAVERAARKAKHTVNTRLPLVEQNDTFYLAQSELWRDLISDRDACAIARGFHEALANAVCDGAVWMRDRYGLRDVTLSGGVFQNRLLLELTQKKLIKAEFRVYRNMAMPSNDGGIALGQLYLIP